MSTNEREIIEVTDSIKFQAVKLQIHVGPESTRAEVMRGLLHNALNPRYRRQNNVAVQILRERHHKHAITRLDILRAHTLKPLALIEERPIANC
jgi:hypothetical protein